MKKFIIQTVTFLFIIIVLFIVIIIKTSTYINEEPSFYKLDPSIENIILGHSHPEGSFNDSMIAKTKNLASSGELYYYTFLKVKKLLKENTSIKRVFVEFTNNQITNDMGIWAKDEESLNYNIPKYFPQMKMSDYKHLLNLNKWGVLKSLKYVFRDNITFLLKNKKNIIKGWGGYNYMDKSHVDSLITAQKKGEIYIQDVSQVNTSNIYYLDKIIDYCKQKKVQLILIRSPLHKEYLGLLNESKYKNILNKRYHNVAYVDFKSFPLKNNEFRDLDHLNYKGTEKVSLFFNELLKDSIFSKPNYQQLINKRIKELSK